MVKNPLASAGDTRDAGSTPGPGRSPEVENGNPLQYPCLKIPWTEEPCFLNLFRLRTQILESFCFSFCFYSLPGFMVLVNLSMPLVSGA